MLERSDNITSTYKGEIMRIARYESKSGKHWAELHEESNEHGVYYRYSAPGCGGSIVANSIVAARAAMDQRVASGYFQPDANKTPMRLVWAHSPAIEALEAIK